MSNTESTTKAKMPNEGYAGGHASIVWHLWRADDFTVRYERVAGNAMVHLHIGLFSLSVTPEQWRAIADAVESVLPQAVEA